MTFFSPPAFSKEPPSLCHGLRLSPAPWIERVSSNPFTQIEKSNSGSWILSIVPRSLLQILAAKYCKWINKSCVNLAFRLPAQNFLALSEVSVNHVNHHRHFDLSLSQLSRLKGSASNQPPDPNQAVKTSKSGPNRLQVRKIKMGGSCFRMWGGGPLNWK